MTFNVHSRQEPINSNNGVLNLSNSEENLTAKNFGPYLYKLMHIEDVKKMLQTNKLYDRFDLEKKHISIVMERAIVFPHKFLLQY